MLGGDGDREVQRFSRVGRREFGLGPLGRVVGCGFGGRDFGTRGCFLYRLPSSRYSGCWGFGLKFLRPGRLPGGGHFRLLGRLRDRLRREIWIRGWSGGGGLEDTPLSQVLLLGRGPALLSFRSGRVACGCGLTGSPWLLLCKRHPRPFPLYTAPVVRCVVAHAATALGLLPRGRAPTGEVGAPTRDAPGRVSAFTPRVSSGSVKVWKLAPSTHRGTAVR